MTTDTDWWNNPASYPYHPALVQGAAASGGVVTPQELANQIGKESSFDPSAKSTTSSATGIAQILSGTAKQPGYGLSSVDPTDPNASIVFAGAYDGARGVSGYSGGTYSAADIATDNTQPVGLNLATSSDASTTGAQSLTDLESGASSLADFKATNDAVGTTGSNTQTGAVSVITNYATRFTVIVLGLILMAGGLYLLGDSKIIQAASAIGGAGKKVS